MLSFYNMKSALDTPKKARSAFINWRFSECLRNVWYRQYKIVSAIRFGLPVMSGEKMDLPVSCVPGFIIYFPMERKTRLQITNKYTQIIELSSVT